MGEACVLMGFFTEWSIAHGLVRISLAEMIGILDGLFCGDVRSMLASVFSSVRSGNVPHQPSPGPRFNFSSCK